MRIHNITPNYIYNYPVKTAAPSFSAQNPIETLTHYNIGMMPNGCIGKIRVKDAKGIDRYLDVYKVIGAANYETYFIKDKSFRVIGEMRIQIRNGTNYIRREFPQDPSYVWVDELNNYSSPRSKNVYPEEYKYIGTRLLQIAQRRSDESGCNGEIKLHTKDKAKEFYELLGFEEVETLYQRKQNEMYLPPYAKEPLSRKYGGL